MNRDDRVVDGFTQGQALGYTPAPMVQPELHPER